MKLKTVQKLNENSNITFSNRNLHPRLNQERLTSQMKVAPLIRFLRLYMRFALLIQFSDLECMHGNKVVIAAWLHFPCEVALLFSCHTC